ncbi:hypothetical protein [Brevifollis gellanilyticus]|uniref:Competence protein ComEA n=1 Tax=Brevifollis gellanilyticus TaxID=748831 RepID=A0A512M4J6_9BACT|nr:hypothetical protein [Brevifollis gellanilyticus]GEP41650.1 hypothetical protein BGE01nite_09410 [Brevifollis gellanilyticus]
MKMLWLLCFALLMAPPVMSAETGRKEPKPSGRAKVAALSLTSAQRYRLLEILNEGNESMLRSLPGIGGTRALAIQKARPYLEVIDLLKAEGVGEQSLVDIVAHAKAGFPVTKEEKSNTKKS